MKNVKQWFSTKTPRGRAVRTGLQAFVGLSTMLAAVVALPEFSDFMKSIGMEGQLVVISAFIGVLSRLQYSVENIYKRLADWAEEEK